jgi:bacteriorhodopsin
MLNKHHHIIKHSANASLLVQILTAIIDLYVLMLNIPKPFLVLKQLLILEFIVQIVEGTFYVWLATSFQTIENITPYRYYDWFITTPTMLITFTIYLIYLNDLEDNKEGNKNEYNDEIDKKNNDINKNDDFFKILKNNSTNLTYIIILNAIMLTFGLLNEHNILNKYVAVFCGFIPFVILFYLIYDNYAKYSKQGTTIFIYFCSIWSIYGVAALMPYHWKNIFYNILDLFAKNFFGLYLAYILWVNSK